MILWILIGVLAAAAACGLATPFFARRSPAPRTTGPIEVLQTQLAEVESEVSAGRLGGAEAEGLRAEIARRLLAESDTPRAPAAPAADLGRRGTPPWMGAACAAASALAAIGLYAAVGRPDLAGASGRTAADAGRASANSDFAALVGQLQARMGSDPGDPKGWRLLGWSLTRLGRFAEAADAYGRAAALQPASAEDRSARGEALTQAAGGQVTAAALAAFRDALARDGADPRARFYRAMAAEQGGDHAGAMRGWTALLRDAPPNAPWVADVRAAVERIAAREGEALSDQPPAPNRAPAGQAAMIEAMVERLAGRLKTDPRDADGWVRLMRARMVLGQGAAARAAYDDALAAFADSPLHRTALRDAARSLGVPGA